MFILLILLIICHFVIFNFYYCYTCYYIKVRFFPNFIDSSIYFENSFDNSDCKLSNEFN